MTHSAHCYKFVFHEAVSYEEASISCQAVGSGLVSVNNIQEHTFITQYLNRHAVQSGMGWYTSGQVVSSVIRWFGDGSQSVYDQSDYMFWNQDTGSYFENDRVVYTVSETSNKYGWSKLSGYERRNYICEIPLNEVYRIVQLERDFDFGVPPGTDILSLPKGPVLINEMIDLVVVDSFRPLVIDCVATGTPQPTYTWNVRESSNDPSNDVREINTDTSSRYTFSNGRLTITDPQESEDAGIYQCKAENTEGSILSPPLSLSFGYLHEFSPNQQGSVEAVQGQGTFLSCNPPSAKPGLVYTWYKDTINNFIRPELDKFYFISSNGNLYLSETQRNNGGNYFCVVTLVPNPGEQLTTNQPPSRTSRAIELRVPGNPNADFGPIIHPDFIAVFPKPPLVGHDVRLECFAYGSVPLQYSWYREGADFPPGTRFLYDNRVLVIPNAQMDAAGNYTCTVLKLTGMRNVDSQKITLNLESKPYFIYPMRNIHADVGSKLTWRCEARATPRATYTWYKNSNILERVPGEIEIRGNVLTIVNLDKSKHEGMYQCEAKNVHGTALTMAQLRVLSIVPTFSKYPLRNSYQTAQGGNLTIPCTPEAAPHPLITWLHNGQPIGVGDQRRYVTLDGTLRITDVQFSDQGVYTCKAENDNGADETSTRVSVITGIQFLRKPQDQNVRVNQTAFLFCDVSYNYGEVDLIYSWKFNGHLIDTDDHPYYRKGASNSNNGLYIINAQYKHTGQYECVAQTVLVSISAAAFVEVTGPPSAPAGVFIDRNPDGNNTVRLMWTWNPAANHGFPVTYFDIEARTDFSDKWSVLKHDIPQHETLIQNMDMKRFYDLTELLPHNSYRFRVRAKNAMGVGLASEPSIKYRVPAAEPETAPSITNTGGGVEGVLLMEWEPLPRSEEAGPGFGYKVYWRLEAETQKAFKEEIVGNVSFHAVTVGQDNYYLRYVVKVQAYNDEGFGPIGPQAVVYSAEGMPVINPLNIRCDAVNATAVVVSWDPVPNNRESLKGVVAGYEVMYYGLDDADDTGGVIVYGQTDHGVVIGLEPNTNYWVYVVVFNGAGPSVLSEIYLCETSLYPPGEYPHFVDVYSHGPNSVRVKWRGVMQVAGEGSLVGYKLKYWPVGDDIRTANDTEVDKVFETELYGILPDVIYNLRIMAVNDGGDGKKSPTVYFTLLKDGSVSVDQSSFDPSTSEILTAEASCIHHCLILLMLCFWTCMLYYSDLTLL
ncbi:ATP-dependent DNA helicase chl1 [Mactra antiquata]